MAVNGINNRNSVTYGKSVNNAANSIGSVNSTNYNSFKNAFNAAVGTASNTTTTSLESIFSEASKTYGVSENLLKAIAKAESNFNADAKSSAGAQGIMQLMPSTAKSLGVSDPYDAKQSIMAGAKLISGLIDKYDGNTQLALAAYNAGSGNVAKYGGIPPFKETQNYVKKVMGYYNGGVTIDSSKNVYTSLGNTNSTANSTAISTTNDNNSNASVYFSNGRLLNGSVQDAILMKILQSQMDKEFNKEDTYEEMIY